MLGLTFDFSASTSGGGAAKMPIPEVQTGAKVPVTVTGGPAPVPEPVRYAFLVRKAEDVRRDTAGRRQLAIAQAQPGYAPPPVPISRASALPRYALYGALGLLGVIVVYKLVKR